MRKWLQGNQRNQRYGSRIFFLTCFRGSHATIIWYEQVERVKRDRKASKDQKVRHDDVDSLFSAETS
jgi:hypothetical protein